MERHTYTTQVQNTKGIELLLSTPTQLCTVFHMRSFTIERSWTLHTSTRQARAHTHSSSLPQSPPAPRRQRMSFTPIRRAHATHFYNHHTLCVLSILPCTNTHARTHARTRKHARTHTHTHTHIHTHTNLNLHISVWQNHAESIHTYIYTHTHTHTHTRKRAHTGAWTRDFVQLFEAPLANPGLGPSFDLFANEWKVFGQRKPAKATRFS